MIIKVHQSLHGYSEGHRQLACSAKLSTQDAKLVLVMSDVSGSGVASDDNSYLTGYPLQDANMYALARTWSAPEMPRPGCVWTHTLFIEYPDLAAISAPSRLEKLFARPEMQAWSNYGVPATLDLHDFDEFEPRLSRQEEDWLAAVLNALYEFPLDRVVARRGPAVSAEALTLRTWDQQWPRLRRSFRFCTFTTKDRSTSGAAFDLQLLPGIESAHRLRLPGTKVAEQVLDASRPGWLATLMDDARQPNLSGLRDTLKRLGADILAGREAMPLLCDFHRVTSRPASLTVLQEAIDMLERPGPLSSSAFARAQVAEHVLRSVEHADPRALAFLWDNWTCIDPARFRERLPQVAGALWRSSPGRLLSALRNDADGSSGWAAQVLTAVPATELLEDWPEGEVPLRDLLAVRKDLLGLPAFWQVADVRSPGQLQGIDLPDQAVGALIGGMQRETGMRAAVQLLGPLRVLDALRSRSRVGVHEFGELRWVQYCVSDTSVVADFLSRVEVPSVPLLLELTNLLHPDAVPNHYGDDPWHTVLLKVKSQTGSLPSRLAAYGFARALGWSSRNSADLLQLTFEQLHGAVSNSSLEEANWQLIEPRLPWVADSERWNRGGRLRDVLVGTFMDRRLWAAAFAWTASSNDLFIDLMESAGKRWGGRRFLKNVEESLEDKHDLPSDARRELIHSFVKSLGRW